MDPLSSIMAGSMAIDFLSRPLQEARDRKDLGKDIKAQRIRLQKNETLTSNPYVNAIRETENKRIENKALDIEATKGRYF